MVVETCAKCCTRPHFPSDLTRQEGGACGPRHLECSDACDAVSGVGFDASTQGCAIERSVDSTPLPLAHLARPADVPR